MNNFQNKLLQQKIKLAVIGLGYVGLPLAVAFAKKGVSVIGFDIDQRKIANFKKSRDETSEVSEADFKKAEGNILFTHEASDLAKASFLIIGVPTPIDENKKPDLAPLESASTLVGKNLQRDSIVVYESTVYPGLTEEICLPILEQKSGLRQSRGDFFIGYSPERINPGDKEHSLETMTKVVAGQDIATCDEIAAVYNIVVGPGCYKAQSIKVAEMAKVIENTQRDINIALMNELSHICHRVGISTRAVLEAAGTKWNFLKFTPGLVGGHCIGVDPFYLTTKADQLGYHPQVVLSGRRINDAMGVNIAQATIKELIKAGQVISGAHILVLGYTFKENVSDIRNTKVSDIIKELESYGCQVSVYDPHVLPNEQIGSVQFKSLAEISNVAAVILATAHREIIAKPITEYFSLCRKDQGKPVFIDIKWGYTAEAAQKAGFHYWMV